MPSQVPGPPHPRPQARPGHGAVRRVSFPACTSGKGTAIPVTLLSTLGGPPALEAPICLLQGWFWHAISAMQSRKIREPQLSMFRLA